MPVEFSEIVSRWKARCIPTPGFSLLENTKHRVWNRSVAVCLPYARSFRTLNFATQRQTNLVVLSRNKTQRHHQKRTTFFWSCLVAVSSLERVHTPNICRHWKQIHTSTATYAGIGLLPECHRLGDYPVSRSQWQRKRKNPLPCSLRYGSVWGGAEKVDTS